MRFIGFLLSCVTACSICGGELGGFLKNGNNSCSYAHIKQPQGEVFPSPAPFNGCDDKGSQSLGIPRTAKSQTNHNLFFMTGTGGRIFSVAFGSGQQQDWAALPSSYNFTVGLEYLENLGLFMLTTSDMYVVKAATEKDPSTRVLEHVATMHQLLGSDLSQDAVLTSNENFPFLFVVDGVNVITIDLSGASPIASSHKMVALSRVMDLAVWCKDTTNITSLLALENYKLYTLDQTTGASTFIMDIPDGSGFPRVNDIFGDTFFFSDFDKLYTVSVSTATVLTNASFDGALLVSNFKFHL